MFWFQQTKIDSPTSERNNRKTEKSQQHSRRWNSFRVFSPPHACARFSNSLTGAHCTSYIWCSLWGKIKYKKERPTLSVSLLVTWSITLIIKHANNDRSLSDGLRDYCCQVADLDRHLQHGRKYVQHIGLLLF